MCLTFRAPGPPPLRSMGLTGGAWGAVYRGVCAHLTQEFRLQTQVHHCLNALRRQLRSCLFRRGESGWEDIRVGHSFLFFGGRTFGWLHTPKGFTQSCNLRCECYPIFSGFSWRKSKNFCFGGCRTSTCLVDVQVEQREQVYVVRINT